MKTFLKVAIVVMSMAFLGVCCAGENKTQQPKENPPVISIKQQSEGLYDFCTIHLDEYTSMKQCGNMQINSMYVFYRQYMKPAIKRMEELPGDLKIKDCPSDIQLFYKCYEGTKTGDDRWPHDYVKAYICMDQGEKDIQNRTF